MASVNKGVVLLSGKTESIAAHLESVQVADARGGPMRFTMAGLVAVTLAFGLTVHSQEPAPARPAASAREAPPLMNTARHAAALAAASRAPGREDLARKLSARADLAMTMPGSFTLASPPQKIDLNSTDGTARRSAR
jgi:hypothetical protein